MGKDTHPAPPVLAMGQPPRRSNAQLIVDLATLGHLRPEWATIDLTYGRGAFWRKWRPDFLATNDADPTLDVDLHRDVTEPHLWPVKGEYEVAVLDPPYKLNGTPTGRGPAAADVRYGVNAPASVAARLSVIAFGTITACWVANRRAIVKVQDQVVSGDKVWLTDMVTTIALEQGWRKVDRLDVYGHRKQPTRQKCRRCLGAGVFAVPAPDHFDGPQEARLAPCVNPRCDDGWVYRRWQHAHIDYSTCLVFAPDKGADQ